MKIDFRSIDSSRFEARAFVGGKEQSKCGIWLGGLTSMNALLFSFQGVGNGNSYNESMSVRDDGYTLFLEPVGFTMFGQQQNKKLTNEGAAEYFWTLFVEKLR